MAAAISAAPDQPGRVSSGHTGQMLHWMGAQTRAPKRVLPTLHPGPSALQAHLAKGTVPPPGLGAGFTACQLPIPLSFLPAVSHLFFPHCQLP